MLGIGLFLACEPENLSDLSIDEAVSSTGTIENKMKNRGRINPQQTPKTENLRDLLLKAVVPSDCGATEFQDVVWKKFTELASDELAVQLLDRYSFLQENAVRLRINTDYYGKNGSHTQHVRKIKRTLQRFWAMPNEIEVLGQHNETLNDRDAIAKILYYNLQDDGSWEDVYREADELIRLNKLSPMLPESPFFAADGFARPNNEIVLGDGLMSMFSETGLEEEIVWTGILSHEWAHQVQFNYFAGWYPDDYFDSVAERTRAIELEADFFSGYFMTHKRGATYNWKRAEDFFELFYQSGDCSFEFEQHHGTPLQRKKATYEGHLLAESTRKKGHILTAEALHEIFISKVLPETVNELQYL